MLAICTKPRGYATVVTAFGRALIGWFTSWATLPCLGSLLSAATVQREKEPHGSFAVIPCWNGSGVWLALDSYITDNYF
ncbi:hypothetical protein GQ44DRAFT_713206 [Phaeosphaeriaceae sp. PMI808]|nr:hypothetical protein GQ44DRAFT_713206 [Phaeosphaeriaceae sp. PMI808]